MLHHTQKYNVLIIITDQQRGDTIGYANNFINTPHLDKLAKNSVVCTHAYTQSPQCQPSRASLLTGRYPTAHRVWWNGIDMPRSELTIGNYLRTYGYKTGYFGKLHFTGKETHTKIAKHFGFDTTFLYEDWVESLKLLNSEYKGKSVVEKEFYEPMNTGAWTGRLSFKELHHEEIITDHAVNFMEVAQEPFVCIVGYHGPHPPYAAPDEFSKLYNISDIPSQKIVTPSGYTLSSNDWKELKKQYYGSISWIDSCVGRLLKSIGRDTIVIFTSDHGDILGDHGLFSKGLFAYEGNIHVPLIMKLPDIKPIVYKHLIQLIDIVPTIFEACDMPIYPAIQGLSLLDGINGNYAVNENL